MESFLYEEEKVVDEIKNKYLPRKDNFLETKKRLESMIHLYEGGIIKMMTDINSGHSSKKLEDEISKYEDRIKRIKLEIEQFRPKTDNGKKICDNCDCISMAVDERYKKTETDPLVYSCEICGRSSLDNYVTS